MATIVTRAAYSHFTRISTRWMDCDVYGHVNNVVYYSYFDTAVNQFLVENKLLDPQTSEAIGLVVETHCQYVRSISFPDTVHVGVRTAHLGNSSVRYEIGLFTNDDPEAAARGHFVHVYVDRISRKPTAIPTATRAALTVLKHLTPDAAKL